MYGNEGVQVRRPAPDESPKPRHSLLPAVVLMLVLAIGIGTGIVIHRNVLAREATDETKATIAGPDVITHAGQLALFHADIPGRSPRDLIYTWGVEPMSGSAVPAPTSPDETMLLPTHRAGQVQFLTIAGTWRLWCAITDPQSRRGTMVSRVIKVPASVVAPTPPGPAPEPAPAPNNSVIVPSPVPAPPLPPPPASRFADFTTDVRNWLKAVQSADKQAEVAALRSAALQIVTDLRTGTLSHESGVELELHVRGAVKGANTAAIQNPKPWQPFMALAGTRITTVLKSGALKTPGDFADILQAFADGLQ